MPTNPRGIEERNECDIEEPNILKHGRRRKSFGVMALTPLSGTSEHYVRRNELSDRCRDILDESELLRVLHGAFFSCSKSHL